MLRANMISGIEWSVTGTPPFTIRASALDASFDVKLLDTWEAAGTMPVTPPMNPGVLISVYQNDPLRVLVTDMVSGHENFVVQ